MSRLKLLVILAFVSISAFAQDLSVEGFNNRFTLVKNEQGNVTVIKLKRATTHFTIRPFIEQLKNDLLGEQSKLAKMSSTEIDEMMLEMGINPYALGDEGGSAEAQHFRDSVQNIMNIDVESAFAELDQREFWDEFQTRLNEAVLFLDPTVVANLDDARFFYKRAVTYKVVTWALQQAQKKFSNIPVLNIATFIIVRVHDMMLEQRHFAHNMLLHYFEKLPESKLGMTKLEVDRAVSSIYEYRIDPTNYFESNNAAADWANYGINKFYMMVRNGNWTIQDWTGPFSSQTFKDVKKLNFAFASVTEADARKIYHLNHTAHMFSSKPALAYDYSNPKRVKRFRSLLNLGGVALGFLRLPNGIKSAVDSFIKSLYVQQVRTEGALIGYFESTGDTEMIKSIYSQRSNLYIVE